MTQPRRGTLSKNCGVIMSNFFCKHDVIIKGNCDSYDLFSVKPFSRHKPLKTPLNSKIKLLKYNKTRTTRLGAPEVVNSPILLFYDYLKSSIGYFIKTPLFFFFHFHFKFFDSLDLKEKKGI